MWIAYVVLAMALAQVGPAPQGPAQTISWADIERAKTLLAQARGELQPQQFEVLEQELVQAESAFQRFSTLAKARGQTAEVARGAEALVGAQRASQIAAEL